MGQSRAELNEQKRRFWERHLKAWRESGLLQSEYCRKHGLRVNQFVYWKKKIGAPFHEERQCVPAAKPLVPLVELPAALVSAQAAFCVEGRNGGDRAARASEGGDRRLHEYPSAGAPLRLLIDGRYCVEIERGYDSTALEHLIRILTRP